MGGGVTIMEIRGHGGIMHFGNSEGRGELKYGSRPWYGMDIFWNCPIEMYFCKGYDYREKVDLSKGYWNPKRKMWVTMHFFRDN